ncbi:MAG TPA: hypothetical protein VFT99_06450 [Roseiflexaceae bacterium]|nr:hypothetical protein [Roseiflexaceae bacterium]
MHVEYDPNAPVLVCLLNNQADYLRVRHQHWYRVPLARAPQPIAAHYLAFYLSARFGADRWAVRWFCAVEAVRITTRAELLPAEHAHPRAAQRYYRFALGPLEALPAAVPSRRLRRITFIPTTMARLLEARDVVELWQPARTDAGEVWGAGIGRRRGR